MILTYENSAINHVKEWMFYGNAVHMSVNKTHHHGSMLDAQMCNFRKKNKIKERIQL